jgi:Clp amino terminal domain, pathogenicity island component
MSEERPELAALRAAVEHSRRLSELNDELIGRRVAEARAAGASWTEIGQLFGTSKQAAQQRYGGGIADPARWTPAAREALDRAAADARRLGHDYVGTEHALLALVGAEPGIAAAVLGDLGVTRERVLATSCMQRGTGDLAADARLELMPRLKQALERGRRIADRCGVQLADTEHLLAGIVAVEDSMAVEILRRLRVNVTGVRAALAERLEVEPERLGAPTRRRRRLRSRLTPL